MEFEKYLPRNMCDWLINNSDKAGDITLIADKNMFISSSGITKESPHFVTKSMLEDIVTRMCRGSIYANQHTLKHGFITLQGGIRVGVTGKCIVSDEKISYMRNITAINIRIPRDLFGVADKVMEYIENSDRVFNTLIISPPSGGKTTLLKDIARQLGNKYRVGVADERGEFSDCSNLGKYTFVMEDCEKDEGIVMLLRSMSPQVIITDEIGTEKDEYAIRKVINAGAKTICTAHGFDERDIMRRNVFKSLLKEKIFERIIVLSGRNGPGTLEKVIDNKE